jgi:acyl-CoA synthetase (AMP-forming)/AMP-acid ligase II
MFACNKIGAILTGLNWRLAPAEIQSIVADAMPTVIITSPEEAHLLTPTAQQQTGVSQLITLGEPYQQWRVSAGDTDPGHEGAPDEVALLLYTSGTTGLPKGVMLTNQGMSYTPRLGTLWGMGPDCVNLVAMPMFHIGGCGYGTSAMTVGGHTVLMREVNTAHIIHLIAQYRVTHTFLVPTVVQALLEVHGVKQADFSSFKWLMYGAAPMGDVLLRRAMDTLRCEFIQAYGMTELSPLATLNPAWYHTAEGRKAGKLRSAGRASHCTEVRIVDAEGRELPRGTVGEVIVRGPNVMQGYWNKPEQTAAALKNGWMHTGDGAYMDEDGFIFIADRLKDMIISGGENIYSAEVENALAQHPSIAACAVIGIPSEQWGESVHAVVVRKPGQDPTPEALIAHCKSLIAGYKCPRSIDFVEALPLSGAGKVLKTALREPFWKGRTRNVA